MGILELIKKEDGVVGVVGSPSDSFEAIVDIRDVSEESKLLGELVCFTVKEGADTILVLGQITDIHTENRWHEEPSFKGIIKRHGILPNLSGVADNRIAKINIQSCFKLAEEKNEAHKLANSPSTGEPVKKINNQIMQGLVHQYKGQLVCLGKAYDTDVDVPFWFKHFGASSTGGAGDAYHIGVFGRTGSGKTVTAANMLLGYARHSKHISILILDPQEQFYKDVKVIPNGRFKEQIEKTGMKYYRLTVPDKVSLPNDPELFGNLLLDYGFIRKAFRIHSDDKRELMAESISEYIIGKMHNPSFRIGTTDPPNLLSSMLSCFNNKDRYLQNVYAKGQYLDRLKKKVAALVDKDETLDDQTLDIWNKVCGFFKEDGKTALDDIVQKVVCEQGNTIVLNISGRGATAGMESIQTRFVKIIEDAIKDKGQELYANGEQSNCLVVLDEAHRYISTYTYSDDIKMLTMSIIDAVRTTRKYGIGYMFITQTIESLHEEIRRQIRIFAFGYGLTSGSEYNKIRNIINDDTGAKFYRSFIDPASNGKFPFMFYGPISPLSFTGAPLFLEMNGTLSEFHH